MASIKKCWHLPGMGINLILIVGVVVMNLDRSLEIIIKCGSIGCSSKQVRRLLQCMMIQLNQPTRKLLGLICTICS